jgi:hypothetical protein
MRRTLAREILAFDKLSMRSYDVDGRLHVASCNISKATVNPYRGREIPGHEQLGLDPDRVYQLYRDPDELARAAPTFTNLQLLMTHTAVNADDPKLQITVGTIGSDTRFEYPYLKASVAVWTAEAIKLIESKAQAQLSSSYRYTADMTPGVTPQGVAYDGVMRHIIGNHVALVEEGRAGPDVCVSDSLPLEFRTMKFPKLLALLKPYLKANSDADLLALDSKLEEAMDERDEEEESAEDEAELERETNGRPDPEHTNRKAKDKKRAKDKKHAKDAGSLGANPHGADEAPESPEGGARKPSGANDSAEFITKADADKMATDAADAAVKRVNALHKARKDVEPLVGIVAFDSAEQVYEFALKQCGVALEGVPATAYGALVAAELRGRSRATPAPRLASDAAPGVMAAIPGLDRFGLM